MTVYQKKKTNQETGDRWSPKLHYFSHVHSFTVGVCFIMQIFKHNKLYYFQHDSTITYRQKWTDFGKKNNEKNSIQTN